jgi:hypothetical protein
MREDFMIFRLTCMDRWPGKNLTFSLKFKFEASSILAHSEFYVPTLNLKVENLACSPLGSKSWPWPGKNLKFSLKFEFEASFLK